MSDPFLILHKVRDQPAFDIAERITCSRCGGDPEGYVTLCDECDGQGHWWIIPTSGHRAYPYWDEALDSIELSGFPVTYLGEAIHEEPMPHDWPDHYPSKRAADKPSIPASALLADLGLVEKERRRG